MINLKNILLEVLDDPYKHSHSFTTELMNVEDEETGETYKKDILSPVQIIKFKTDEGIPYIWYAKQSRYDNSIWEIAFGIETGVDYKGTYQLNIGLSKTGNASRVFATVIDITNSFIEFDGDNYEIRIIVFTAKENKRAEFYIKRLVPLIDNFKVKFIDRKSDETEIVLIRTD